MVITSDHSFNSIISGKFICIAGEEGRGGGVTWLQLSLCYLCEYLVIYGGVMRGDSGDRGCFMF